MTFVEGIRQTVEPREPLWPDREIQILKDGAAKGLSGGMIVKLLGGRYTRSAIIGKAHRLGIVIRSARGPGSSLHHVKREWTEEEVKNALFLYDRGWQKNAIAAELKRPYDHVLQLLRDHGRLKTKEAQPKPEPIAAAPAPKAKPKPPAPLPGPSKAFYFGNGPKRLEPAGKSEYRVEPPAPPNPIPYLERTERQCAWPIGDPLNFDELKCCGALVYARKSYCLNHLKASSSDPAGVQGRLARQEINSLPRGRAIALLSA